MSELTESPNPYAVFPGLKEDNGCEAVICTRCWATSGEQCKTRFGNPADRPHLVRIARADTIAYWEQFERERAKP